MPRKVLAIDDQPNITRAIGLVVQQLGLEFRPVNCPLDAIEQYIAYRPDIVMIDMIMPEKDGIDVLDEILLIGAPVRVVLMSGYGEAYLRLAVGVAQFHERPNISILRKPFRNAELVTLLSGLRGA
jgi:CheY-like chemotaxis protein